MSSEPCRLEGCPHAPVTVCGFRLKGKKEGQACGAALCAHHRHPGAPAPNGQSPGIDVCPGHAMLTWYEHLGIKSRHHQRADGEKEAS